MIYQGNDQFSIQDNFDFDRHPGDFFTKRNIVTLIGSAAVFGKYFNTPINYPNLHFWQPNRFFGGPFPVKFRGTVTIK